MLKHYLEEEVQVLGKYRNGNINTKNVWLDIDDNQKGYVCSANSRIGPFDDILIFKDLTPSEVAESVVAKQAVFYAVVKFPDSDKWSISKFQLNTANGKLTFSNDLYSSSFPIVPVSYTYSNDKYNKLFFYMSNASLEWELKEVDLNNMNVNTLFVLPPQAEQVIQLTKMRYANLNITLLHNLKENPREGKETRNPNMRLILCQYDNILEIYSSEDKSNPAVFLELAQIKLLTNKRSIQHYDFNTFIKNRDIYMVDIEYLLQEYEISKNAFSKEEMKLLANDRVKSTKLLSISFSDHPNKTIYYVVYDDPYLNSSLLQRRNAPTFVIAIPQNKKPKEVKQDVVNMIKAIVNRYSASIDNNALQKNINTGNTHSPQRISP